jgi:hypothetical protein
MISIPTTGEARKIGDAIIFVEIDEEHPEVRAARRGWYKAAVLAGGEIWTVDIGSPPSWDLAWDDPRAYDEIAASAISFGIHPEWAEDEEIASTIQSATEWAVDEDGVYEVERINEYVENPASFTAKGERMYEHILDGYLQKGIQQAEAKRIAAATVYARSASVPGLVKSRYSRNPETSGYSIGRRQQLQRNPRLTAQQRRRIPARQYAVPELRKLPIEDENHIRNAMARFNQVKGLSREQKERAFDRIVNAAARHGIDATGFVERYSHYA